MPDISNPIWGVIGVIATIIFGLFGIAGVILAFLQLIQTNKQLSYKILSITPILEISEEYQDQIEISINKQTFKKIHLVIIQFFNSGRAPIKPDDYIYPLKLSIGNGQIINLEIMETQPKNLGEIVELHDTKKIIFKRVLLNARDKFVVKLLVGEFNGSYRDIIVDARIIGVNFIRNTQKNRSVQKIQELLESPNSVSLVVLVMAVALFPIFLSFLISVPLVGGAVTSLIYFLDGVIARLNTRRK